jgi:hypothetical protein
MTRSASRLSDRGECLDGLAELVFCKTAHLRDQLAQLAKLFIKGLYDVIGHGSSALSGWHRDQPKRPVM